MVGFASTQYVLAEASSSHVLPFEVLTPSQSLISDVTMTVTAVDGTASGGYKTINNYGH